MAKVKTSSTPRVQPRNKQPQITEEVATPAEDGEVGEEEAEDGTDTEGTGDATGPAEGGEASTAPSPQKAATAKPAPKQAGFAKRSGHTSTAPAKPVATQRPYLDSPRPFGVHILGKRFRFAKGRTLLNFLTEEEYEALKNHQYVADNGAEIVE